MITWQLSGFQKHFSTNLAYRTLTPTAFKENHYRDEIILYPYFRQRAARGCAGEKELTFGGGPIVYVDWSTYIMLAIFINFYFFL